MFHPFKSLLLVQGETENVFPLVYELLHVVLTVGSWPLTFSPSSSAFRTSWTILLVFLDSSWSALLWRLQERPQPSFSLEGRPPFPELPLGWGVFSQRGASVTAALQAWILDLVWWVFSSDLLWITVRFPDGSADRVWAKRKHLVKGREGGGGDSGSNPMKSN